MPIALRDYPEAMSHKGHSGRRRSPPDAPMSPLRALPGRGAENAAMNPGGAVDAGAPPAWVQPLEVSCTS